MPVALSAAALYKPTTKQYKLRCRHCGADPVVDRLGELRLMPLDKALAFMSGHVMDVHPELHEQIAREVADLGDYASYRRYHDRLEREVLVFRSILLPSSGGRTIQ